MPEEILLFFEDNVIITKHLYISLIQRNIFHFLNILFSRLKRIYGKSDENLISGFLKR